MTQEDKELLLKDLCGRLPYKVKIELMPITRGKCATLTPIILRDYFISDDVNYLPFLRPMSSMTEEEEYEYHQYKNNDSLEIFNQEHNEIIKTTALAFSNAIDWLNAHYFDYRGLIERGLAIEVTEDNNPYE